MFRLTVASLIVGALFSNVAMAQAPKAAPIPAPTPAAKSTPAPTAPATPVKPAPAPAPAAKTAPAPTPVALCSTAFNTEHTNMIAEYKAAVTAKKIDAKELKDAAALESRLQKHLVDISKGGVNLAECTRLRGELVKEHSKLWAMEASVPAPAAAPAAAKPAPAPAPATAPAATKPAPAPAPAKK